MIKGIESHSREIAELCQRYGVLQLAVFGSAATGHMHSDSDVDLLVEFDLESSSDYADRFFGFQESLKHLFGRPVDLVVESAVKNPYFRQSIEETQELLYADIDDRLVWNIVETKLPALKREVSSLLQGE